MKNFSKLETFREVIDSSKRFWNSLVSIYNELSKLKKLFFGTLSFLGLGIPVITYSWIKSHKLLVSVFFLFFILVMYILYLILFVLPEIRKNREKEILNSVSSNLHDIVHYLRDRLYKKDGKEFRLNKALIYILTVTKKLFNEMYDCAETFVASVTEVDNVDNPSFAWTRFYSDPYPEQRARFRSKTPEGKGVVGKFFEEGTSITELEPMFWVFDDLYTGEYCEIRDGELCTIKEREKVEEIERKKRQFYSHGISSPFVVNGKFRGCINIDLHADRCKNFVKFEEEEKRLLSVLGDLCALCYQIDYVLDAQREKLRVNVDRELVNVEPLDEGGSHV